MSADMLPTQGGRRVQERRRQRQRRRRRLLVGLGVAVAVLVGVTVVTVTGDAGAAPPAAATPSGARTQQTLLWQVRGTSGASASNVLVAHDPAAGRGAALFVPPQVLAAPPGSQAVPFGQVLRTASPESARDALADLVGVTVDAGWVLTSDGLVRLIDGLGGVTVDVDVQVLGGPDGRQIVLTPGRQLLTGVQAAELAIYVGAGEPEQSRLARLQGVLDGLLVALPASQTDVLAQLDRLGAGSSVEGLDMTGLAALLTGLKADSAADALAYDTVPVLAVETGADQASLRLDPDAVGAVVDRLLGPSVPAGARSGGNRVKVFNGVGTPMLGSAVRDRLVTAGLVYVPGGNAGQFGVATTEVQIGDPTPEAQALGARVAQALGVPVSAVRSSTPTSVADAVVVVGADFPAGG